MNEIEKFAGLIPRFTTYDCEYTCEKHGKVKGFFFCDQHFLRGDTVPTPLQGC